jgi:hypothetical protein
VVPENSSPWRDMLADYPVSTLLPEGSPMTWCRIGGLIMLLLWFCGCTTVQTAGNRGFYPSRDPYRDGFPSRYTDLETENPTPYLFRFDTDTGGTR